MISSNDTSSGTSEYLKLKSTLGFISRAAHNSSNVSAETKLLPNSIWLKLKDRVQDIDISILKAVEARKNGKVFSFKEHLKGFIYAQLSALVSWKRIKDNQQELNIVFCV